MHLPQITALLALAATAAAQIGAAKIVEAIAPGSKSCDGQTADCRTAMQASPFIAQAFQDYGIYNVNQMAAVISLMAYESDDFKYKHNISPGRPGQGTANMQMANYNLEYAKQIDGVKDKVAGIGSTDGLSDDKLNGILALVTPDKYNFGSGPWFLTSQCADAKAQLEKDVDAGWTAYMGCVGTGVTPDRQAYMDRAKKAFGIQ